jgi:apolipoprotein N-acyltransferase
LLLLLLLSLWQGGRMALASWLFARARSKGWRSPLVFVACLAASEAVFPLLFPWYLGCALAPSPWMLQSADLGGPILLTSLVGIVNVALAEFAVAVVTRRRRARTALVVAAVALAANLAYGVVRIRQLDARVAAAPELRIGMVQGNIPMEIQGRAAYEEAFQAQVRASRTLVENGAQLVVWSESAFLFMVPEADAARHLGEAFTRSLGAASIVGAVVDRQHPPPPRLFNSALLMGRDGQLRGRYDKHHLLAFGEYLPLGEWFPVLYQWSPNSGHFTAGEGFEPLELDGHRLAILICYEDILPGFVNAAVRQTGAELLVDITNDAWFGETSEPALHLALSQLRAVEQRRYLARAANTGVSAIIDPAGRVVARTATFQRASLLGTVRWLQGSTGYGTWGDLPWYLVAAFSAFMALRAPWRRRTRPLEKAAE